MAVKRFTVDEVRALIKRAKPEFCEQCMTQHDWGMAQTAVDTYEIALLAELLDDLLAELEQPTYAPAGKRKLPEVLKIVGEIAKKVLATGA